MNDWSTTAVLTVAFLVVGGIVGFLVLTYLVSNKLIKGRLERPARLTVTAVFSTLFLFLVVGVVAAFYDEADKDGWVTHSRIALVTMKHDWIVGEFESCVLDGNEKSPVLTCDYRGNAAVHQMNVQFRGSLGPLATGLTTTWNCQRKGESIACKTDDKPPLRR